LLKGIVVLCFYSKRIENVVLYAGIMVNIIVPVFGRKHLVKAPNNIAHLLERLALFTFILFGVSAVSTLSVQVCKIALENMRNKSSKVATAGYF
jgi:low temperature requirement protein LtrA